MYLSLVAVTLELTNFVAMFGSRTCDDHTNNVVKFSTFSVTVFLASISDTLILGLVFRREVFSSGDPWHGRGVRKA